MIDPSCVEMKTETFVQVRENGQKATFHNPNHEVIECISCDKCVMPQTASADFVISKFDCGDVIVELKGKNVERGVQQVLATADHWHKNRYRVGKIAGIIVSKQYPRGSTSVQRAIDQFRKLYKSPLHVISRDEPINFDNVYSFKGPYKS